MKKFLKIFLVLFVIFSMIFSTVMYAFYKNDVDEAVEENKPSAEDSFENLDVSNYKDRVNVLLMGVDTLENEGDGKGTRTDTIMVLSIDPTTKTGFILSLPRDTRVKLANGGDYDKVNHAHSYGGTELAISTIKDFLQIPIHHYVKLDYRALFKTVDDLGGIEVDVPIDMKYKDTRSEPPLNVDLKKGVQTLNGEQAMGFVRFRKGYPNQDLGRIQAQQAFLDALIKKMTSPASIMNIPNYIDTMSKYVETDMDMKTMLIVAKQALSVDTARIEKKTVPGEPDMINGVSYYEPNAEELSAMLDYLLSGNYPVPETEATAEGTEGTSQTGTQSGTASKAAPQAQAKAPVKDTSNYKIQVLNGSGISGVARRATDLLKIEEISVTSTGNASNFDNENTIVYYKDDSNFASQIRNILKVGKIEKGTKDIVSSEPDIVVVLGKDFK
ncbi:MAG: LCP family protein [Proteocatella sp.]